MSKIDKHFVSSIDKKMLKFNETHPKSAAQQAEYEKYQRIYHLRDVPTDQIVVRETVWD
jgi:hypothetical protein